MHYPSSVEGEDDIYRSRLLTSEGYESYRLGDFRKAIQLFNKAMRARPNHPSLVYGLVASNAALGKDKAALQWLSRYAEMGFYLDPCNDSVFQGLQQMREFNDIMVKAKPLLEVDQAPKHYAGISKPCFKESVLYKNGRRLCGI